MSKCKLTFKTIPVQTVQGYKRGRLQWVPLPGQDDSVQGKAEMLHSLECYSDITDKRMHLQHHTVCQFAKKKKRKKAKCGKSGKAV